MLVYAHRSLYILENSTVPPSKGHAAPRTSAQTHTLTFIPLDTSTTVPPLFSNGHVPCRGGLLEEGPIVATCLIDAQVLVIHSANARENR